MSCNKVGLKYHSGNSFSLDFRIRTLHTDLGEEFVEYVSGVSLPEDLVITGKIFSKSGKQYGLLEGVIAENQVLNSGQFTLNLLTDSKNWPAFEGTLEIVFSINGKNATVDTIPFECV